MVYYQNVLRIGASLLHALDFAMDGLTIYGEDIREVSQRF